MRYLSTRSRARLSAALAVPLSVGLLAACGSQPTDHAASSTPPATSSTSSMTPGPATPSSTASTSATSSQTSTTSSPTSQLEEAEGATPLVTPSTSSSSSSTKTPDESTGSSSSTSSPTSSPSSEDDGKDSPAPSTAVLKSGSSGADVLSVQQRLRDLGYWGSSPDGSFGGSTRQSVLALQKAAGLNRTGKVDVATRRALDRGVVPRSRTGASKAIEIDLERQILLAVEGGKVKAVINASSGNGEKFVVKNKKTGTETTYHARTPRGSFAVYAEDNKLHESTLELGSMWRPKYFSGAIAVHGSGSVPAYPASHGCVRVSNSAMNWIWDSWGLPIGTKVKVY